MINPIKHSSAFFSVHATRGFSLVELSVVLVILGLLVGGILTGRGLIKAAELRSVSAEYSEFKRAALTFKAQYGALPGDYRDATTIWQRIGDTCNTMGTGSGTGGRTCNGNGNGQITGGTVSDAGNFANEGHMFWNHLSLAKLIPGQYTGISGTNNGETDVIGTNVPGSEFKNGGWNIDNSWDLSGSPSDFALDFGRHFLEIGAATTNDSDLAIFTPEEARSIDQKYDDGIPSSGVIIARFWNNNCSRAASGTGDSARDNLDAVYYLDNPLGFSARCTLVFRDGF